MLGTVFLEMFPESIALTKNAPILVLAGLLHRPHLRTHFRIPPALWRRDPSRRTRQSGCRHLCAGWNAGAHVFRWSGDRSRVSRVWQSVGLLIFLAVLLHKIPDGFTISSIAITSGRSRKALWARPSLRCIHFAGSTCRSPYWRCVSYALPLSTGSDALCRRHRSHARSKSRKGCEDGFRRICRNGIVLTGENDSYKLRTRKEPDLQTPFQTLTSFSFQSLRPLHS